MKKVSAILAAMMLLTGCGSGKSDNSSKSSAKDSKAESSIVSEETSAEEAAEEPSEESPDQPSDEIDPSELKYFELNSTISFPVPPKYEMDQLSQYNYVFTDRQENFDAYSEEQIWAKRFYSFDFLNTHGEEVTLEDAPDRVWDRIVENLNLHFNADSSASKTIENSENVTFLDEPCIHQTGTISNLIDAYERDVTLTYSAYYCIKHLNTYGDVPVYFISYALGEGEEQRADVAELSAYPLKYAHYYEKKY